MAAYLEYGFENKTAVITGGGTGMGRACAVELARGGANVAVFGRRLAQIEETAAICREYGARAIAVSCDVSDKDSVNKAVSDVTAAFGDIHILINNAGIETDYGVGENPFDTRFDNMDEDEYLSFYKIHVLGHYNMCLAVIPYMQKNRFGRIVNITSVTGLTGAYSSPAYTSSKAAANCQTKAFARKYGPDNITVNAIAPGMVNTPMKRNSPPAEFEYVASITPLRRVAEPIDIARAAIFFAQENLFITGEIMVADGGSNM